MLNWTQGTALQQVCAATIRERLLKIGVAIIRNTRRIRLMFAPIASPSSVPSKSSPHRYQKVLTLARHKQRGLGELRSLPRNLELAGQRRGQRARMNLMREFGSQTVRSGLSAKAVKAHVDRIRKLGRSVVLKFSTGAWRLHRPNPDE